jgi:SAM-dependent methyltransferase
MKLEKYLCPLCHSTWESFYNEQFQKCSGCQSIFRCPEFFITPDKEKSRYEEHNNDIQDVRYQDFVSPIVEEILIHHTSWESGLDFWAGTWPVISHLLWQKWFETKLYDPFFHNNPELLKQTYDFIISCEVVEHFHNPEKEFELLYSLLKPNGKLYIMTDVYSPEIDFWAWYYKNDKTHVFFYSSQAFQWIQQKWSWKRYSRNNRCIILEK